MPRRAGFSAPEVIAALILISIGGALVAKVGKDVRRISRSTSCESNVKQLALAARMYATDYAGHMPTSPTDFAALNPYTKNQQLLICPEDQAARSEKHRRGRTETPEIKLSYILNPWARPDEEPYVLLIGDNRADRHPGPRWVGARVDGATFLWPANEWEFRLGWVMRNATASKP